MSVGSLRFTQESVSTASSAEKKDSAPRIADVLTVGVPIFNGYDALRACLESLVAQTPADVRLLLADDASTDHRVPALLRAWSQRDPRIEVLTSDINRGFVGNANRLLRAATGDVILLNSDTVVSPGWSEALADAARQSPDVGIVNPLSDNATILTLFAVAHAVGELGPLPQQAIAEILAGMRDWRIAFPLPTAVGFCMYVKRALLDAIGDFDAVFAPGYGEENDLCMRAWRKGFSVVCEPAAYVRHVGSVSFEGVPDIGGTRARNTAILQSRWPQYESWISAYRGVDPRWAIELHIVAEHARRSGRRLIAHCVHAWTTQGGVESYVRRLVAASPTEFMHVVVMPSTTAALPVVEWSARPSSWLVRIPARPDAARPTIRDHPLLSLRAQHYDNFLAMALEILAPALLHVHHLSGSFSLQQHRIARALGLPVVLGIHDYYSICPNYALLKPSLQACTKSHFVATDDECARCMTENLQAPLAAQREIRQVDWHERAALMCDALNDAVLAYAPSRAVVDRVRPFFGAAANRIEVIPHHIYAHARTPEAADTSTSEPLDNGQCRVVVAHLGAFTRAKGAETFVAMQRVLRVVEGIDYWIIGPVAQEYGKAVSAAGIVASGSYAADQLPVLLQNVDIVCCLSAADETYGYTIDEALAAGKPVIATRSRAVVERHRERPGLMLVDFGDHQAAAARVRELLKRGIDAAGTRLEIRDNFDPIFARYRTLCRPVVRDAGAWARDRGPASLRQALQPTLEFGSRVLESLGQCSPGAFGNVAWSAWLARHRLAIARCGADGASLSLVRLSPDAACAGLAAAEESDWIAVLNGDDILDVESAKLAVAQAIASDEGSDICALVVSDMVMARNGEGYAPRFKPRWSPLRYSSVDLLEGCVLYRRDALTAAVAVSEAASDAGNFHAWTLQRIAKERGAHAIAVSEWPIAGRDERRIWRPPPLGRSGSSRMTDALASARIDVVWTLASPKLPASQLAALVTAAVERLLLDSAFGVLYVVAVGNARHRRPLHPRVVWFECGAPSDATWGTCIEEICRRTRCDALALTSLVPDAAFVRAGSSAAKLFGANVVATTALVVHPDGNQHLSSAVALAAGPFSTHAPAIGMEHVDAGSLSLPREVEASEGSALFVAVPALRALSLGDIGFESSTAAALELSMRLRESGGRIVTAPGPWRQAHSAGLPPLDRQIAVLPRTDRHLLLDAGLFDRARSLRIESVASRYSLPPTLEPAPFFPAWIGVRKSRMRVVVAPFDNWGSGYYRTRQPLVRLAEREALDAEFLPDHRAGFMPTVAQLDASEVDVVLAHNPFHAYQIASLADYRRHSRCRLLAGMDDRLDDVPDYNPYAATIYRDIHRRIAAVDALVDGWIFSTRTLAEAYGIGESRCSVIPNTLEERMWRGDITRPRAPATSGRKLRVGWTGARQHSGDLALLEPAFRATRTAVDWVFMGMLPSFVTADEVEFHPMVPFERYPAALRALELDIGLAPLLDNPFNRAKSNIKALEYLAAGAHPICADIGVYDGLPVTLCPPTADVFCAQLLATIAAFPQPRANLPAGSWLDTVIYDWLAALSAG